MHLTSTNVTSQCLAVKENSMYVKPNCIKGPQRFTEKKVSGKGNSFKDRDNNEQMKFRTANPRYLISTSAFKSIVDVM